MSTREETIPDAMLAELCRRGEVSAYEQLYQLHGARMKSVAWNMLKNREDAEDAVQETFVKVSRSAGGFRGNSSFVTWVFRILVNTCRDARSRAGRNSEELPEEMAGGARANPVLVVALGRALEELEPRYREVFLLAESEGFTHPEIAAILNIPEGTSRNWLYEAKKALREALKEGQ
ncbi:MAG: RNA polymerase sigma factor [Acidobacteria bacterium]|nr:RNA polymerase sigma factor [Acidobacteriota bacterium]